MDTIKIRTFLPALRAAALGLVRHGETAVTPSEAEWQATPPELRAHLVDRYLVGKYSFSLDVEAPGWNAVLVAGETSRQQAEEEARKREEEEARKRAAHQAKIVEALAATSSESLRFFDYAVRYAPEVVAHYRALRTAELRAMGPYGAYLSTRGLRDADTPEEVTEWVRSLWQEVVAEATQRAIASGGHPEVHPGELDAAVEGTAAWANFLTAKRLEEEQKEARRRERQARETAALRAWGEAHREVEGVGYALDHGYDLGELLVEHVTDQLRELGEVEVYREGTDAYDALSWQRRARPRAEKLRLSEATERVLAAVGLPVRTGRAGEEIEGDLYLDLVGVCRVEEDDRKSTRVVVRLIFPESGEAVWTLVESYDAAE
jgi:hypothetical protein